MDAHRHHRRRGRLLCRAAAARRRQLRCHRAAGPGKRGADRQSPRRHVRAAFPRSPCGRARRLADGPATRAGAPRRVRRRRPHDLCTRLPRRARGDRSGPPPPRGGGAPARRRRARPSGDRKIRVPPEEQPWAAIEDRLRDALGDSSYAAARAEGAHLSIDDALEWARRARGPRGRPPGGWGSLTATEARVVELVAEGLSNRQIGERMFVSPETVKTHVGDIFKKIGVHSRVELVARAVTRGPTD